MNRITHISYAEFKEWCNERCCDGQWSMTCAITSIAILRAMRKAWFWKRKRLWCYYEQIALRLILRVEGGAK